MANIEYKTFDSIDLSDNFFDSLRESYHCFNDWYNKKSKEGEKAYVLYENKNLLCFLYLKEETPIDNTNIFPKLDSNKKWIKVGTFKVIPHNTKLGERLIKRMFDFAVSKNYFNLYVTIFPKQKVLIDILKKYGFYEYAKKGDELVLVKDIATNKDILKMDICLDFPSIDTRNANKYILGIYPKYHTLMFSDSILKTENFNILKDMSESNSIHKVYIAAMQGVENIKNGDLLIIYRTKDDKAPNANYSSVATSLCVVEEYRHINEFNSEAEFVEYCKPYNIFNEQDLKIYFKTKRYPKIIKMTYNISFKKRIVLDKLRDIIKNNDRYWGFLSITDEEFKEIIKVGEVNESIIIY